MELTNRSKFYTMDIGKNRVRVVMTTTYLGKESMDANNCKY